MVFSYERMIENHRRQYRDCERYHYLSSTSFSILTTLPLRLWRFIVRQSLVRQTVLIERHSTCDKVTGRFVVFPHLFPLFAYVSVYTFSGRNNFVLRFYFVCFSVWCLTFRLMSKRNFFSERIIHMSVEEIL